MQASEVTEALVQAHQAGGMERALLVLIGVLGTAAAIYVWATTVRSAKIQDAANELALKAVTVSESMTSAIGVLRAELAAVRAELSEVRTELARLVGHRG